MTIIDTTTPTVKAIYQKYEDTRTDWRRPHLGASQVGAPCDRALWYQFRWCAPPAFPGRVLRLFDTGNKEEARIVKDLRDIGIEVFDEDPHNPGQQIRYADPGCGGHFSGSLDGIGRGFTEAPKAWHVLEFKTSNAAQFKKLKNGGVEKAKPQHFAQMQCYMDWSGVKRAYYFAVCKDTDEYYGERVPYNEVIAYQCRERAKKIIFADEQPARCNGAKPDGWNCKYCQFSDLCFGKVLPEVNCRTCSHSTPVCMDMKGRWDCERYGMIIDTNRQKDEYCKQHIYIPSLVPMDVSDADADAGTITYADGTINGPGAVSSREMRCKYGKR